MQVTVKEKPKLIFETRYFGCNSVGGNSQIRS
jgi:hypothetical protein